MIKFWAVTLFLIGCASIAATDSSSTTTAISEASSSTSTDDFSESQSTQRKITPHSSQTTSSSSSHASSFKSSKSSSSKTSYYEASNCGSSQKCPVNERYEECPFYLCQPQNCTQLGFPIACPAVAIEGGCPGKPGCVCIAGYLRNHRGICIPEKKCPACGGDPRATAGTGLNCGRHCNNYKKRPVVCPDIRYFNACDCKKDFVIDDNTGRCVLPKDCTPECRKDEVYSDCINGGCQAKNCTQLGKPIPCVKIDPKYCIKGCLCREGYLRAPNGKCVPTEKCKNSCGDNEEPNSCIQATCKPTTCAQLGKPIPCPRIDPQFCKKGCICKEGFLRDENNKCIPQDKCVVCGKNEVFTTCENGGCGHRNCSQLGTPEICIDLIEGACRPGCICKEGFLRDEFGKCVPINKCGHCDKENEELALCPAKCPYRTCGIDDRLVRCAKPLEVGDPNCPKPKCICKTGFFRNVDGECVPWEKCSNPCKKKNEVYDYCPAKCPFRTCGIDDRLIDCAPSPVLGDPNCPPPGCRCANGYFRNDKGECVPWEKCPICSGPNEEYNACPAPCPPKLCGINEAVILCQVPPILGDPSCRPGCTCKDGFVRNDKGICVTKDQCPKCTKPHEYYEPCAQNQCPPGTCESLDRIYACPLILTEQNEQKCRGACLCEPGYYRNNRGECITKEECRMCAKPNQYFTCGGACDNECSSLKVRNQTHCDIINITCNRRCYCDEGHARDANDVCIPFNQCNATCGGDKNAYPGCGSNCGRLCSNYNSPKPIACTLECRIGGCECKKNYVLDTNINKCVEPSKCTPTCKVNEEFTTCVLGVCRNQKCTERGKPVACPALAPGACKPGCVCKNNFLRAANGTCIPEKQCDSPKCKINEEYSDCANGICIPQTCSQKGHTILCKPMLPGSCVGGCICKGKHLRTNNGTCTPQDECESCPEGEQYSTCPPIKCDSEYCPKTRNDPLTCPIPKKCDEPRCICGFNQHRDRKTGKCIATSSCPPFKCDGPNEKHDPCPPVCPGENCTDYLNNSTCPKFRIGIVVPCKPQCRCEKGFYRNSDNICINANSCSTGNEPTCEINEELSSCSNDPCRPQVCSEKGQLVPCKPMLPGSCIEGCLCKEKFLRTGNGTCIPEDQCQKTTCKINEEYSSCSNDPCRPQVCSEKGQLVPCKPLLPGSCIEGCLCKEKFLRTGNGTCVPEDQCQSSTDIAYLQEQVSLGNLVLTLKFLYEIFKANPGSSVIMSAFSVLFLLAQLALYSKGLCHEQLMSTLNLETNEQLRLVIPTIINSYTAQQNVQSDLAAKVYSNIQYALSKPFLDDSKSLLNAEAQSLNFSNSVASAATINKWVADHTNDKIQDLIAPSALSADTRLVLVNAIYFNGDWVTQFDANLTEDRDFHVSKNQTIKVPTMFLKSRFRYAESADLDCKILELPYKGYNFTYVVFLPNQIDGILNLINKIQDPAAIKSSLGLLNYAEVRIYLPSIQTLTTTDLGNVLKQVGISKMFDPADSGLVGILENPENISVTDAVQKAFIVVNERGSEAAAANGITVGVTSVQLPDEVKDFVADHSYLYFINKGNDPIFTGVFTGA